MATESSSSVLDEGRSNEDPPKSLIERAPKLSQQGLVILMIGMALTPIITVFAINSILPPVYQGKLDAKISLQNVPPDSFYQMPLQKRPELESAVIVVENISDVEWTHFYVRVNRYYDIFDTEPFPPGTARTYRLDRFVARVGAVFDIRYVQVKHVEIYARVPIGARRTYEQNF